MNNTQVAFTVEPDAEPQHRTCYLKRCQLHYESSESLNFELIFTTIVLI